MPILNSVFTNYGSIHQNQTHTEEQSTQPERVSWKNRIFSYIPTTLSFLSHTVNAAVLTMLSSMHSDSTDVSAVKWVTFSSCLIGVVAQTFVVWAKLRASQSLRENEAPVPSINCQRLKMLSTYTLPTTLSITSTALTITNCALINICDHPSFSYISGTDNPLIRCISWTTLFNCFLSLGGTWMAMRELCNLAAEEREHEAPRFEEAAVVEEGLPPPSYQVVVQNPAT